MEAAPGGQRVDRERDRGVAERVTERLGASIRWDVLGIEQQHGTAWLAGGPGRRTADPHGRGVIPPVRRVSQREPGRGTTPRAQLRTNCTQVTELCSLSRYIGLAG